MFFCEVFFVVLSTNVIWMRKIFLMGAAGREKSFHIFILHSNKSQFSLMLHWTPAVAIHNFDEFFDRLLSHARWWRSRDSSSSTCPHRQLWILHNLYRKKIDFHSTRRTIQRSRKWKTHKYVHIEAYKMTCIENFLWIKKNYSEWLSIMRQECQRSMITYSYSFHCGVHSLIYSDSFTSRSSSSSSSSAVIIILFAQF